MKNDVMKIDLLNFISQIKYKYHKKAKITPYQTSIIYDNKIQKGQIF